MRQPPCVADFFANLLAADVSALSLSQSESAGVFLNGGIQIFLKLRGFSQPLRRARTRKNLVAALQVLSSRIVILQFEAEVAAQKMGVGDVAPLLLLPLFQRNPC